MRPEAGRAADSTAAVMRETADSLEDTEARLHRSAAESPSTVSSERIDRLADAVTAEAKRIEARAERLVERDSDSRH